MSDVLISREEAIEMCHCLVNAHKLLMNRHDYSVEDFTKCSKTLNNLTKIVDRIRSFIDNPELGEELSDKDNEKNEKGEEYESDKAFPRT